MDIYATINGANVADKSLLVTVRNVALRDDIGNTLITQSAS